MSDRMPPGVHFLDWRAQQIWQEVQRVAEQLQRQMRGSAPLGTRKLTAGQMARRLTTMTAGQAARMLAYRDPGEPIALQALERLGGHGLALLPYLYNPEPPTEAPPEEGVF